MMNLHVAKKLNSVGLTEDGLHCRLDFTIKAGDQSALVFPSDQLDALLGLLLQVERKKVAVSPDFQGAKHVLNADNVEVGFQPETQTILLDFRVGKMQFAFALPREHAVRLIDIVSKRLPSH